MRLFLYIIDVICYHTYVKILWMSLTGLSDEDLLVLILLIFPSIGNQTGIERVRVKLSEYAEALEVPIECVIEALEICLRKNCSMYRGQYTLVAGKWYCYGS